jgi:uncharacterized lipoprotein
MSRIYLSGVIAVVIAALGLNGCSKVSRGFDRVFPDRRTEYQKAETLPDLEIPPELSNSRIQDRMAIPPANATPNATFRERAAAREAAPAMAPAPTATTPTPAATVAPVDNARVQLISAGAGKVYIVLREPFETAWQNVGEALDAAGIAIEDDKPKRGFYKVRVADPEQQQGVMSKLAFWREHGTPYRVSVTEANSGAEIVILDEDGEWDTGAAAGQLLAALYKQLNAATSR